VRKWSFVIKTIVVFLILVGGLYLIKVNMGAGTVEEAIEKSGRHVSVMIYQKTVKDGVVVFYKSNIGNGGYTINSGFVKKGLLGWKWVLGGGFSGYSGQYFQSASGTPFPLIFGEIKNQDIKQVKLIDMRNEQTKVAKVVGPDKNRVWFMFLNESDGPEFELVSSSDKGVVLDSKNINLKLDTNY
jgi:hypothetical protein